MKKLTNLSLVFLMVAIIGCKSVYYNTMEKFGYHKRELLVDRVEDARDTQQEAKEQFQSALEKFTAVINFSGGELEEKYTALNTELEISESKAETVGEHIEDVQDVARALFKEWDSELDQYTNDNLRSISEKKLKQTQQRYEQLISAMRRAEAKIEPVLSAFRDQVLFLKHNLNAQAIASLHDEFISVEADIASLIREMEVSIAEADEFIRSMANEKTDS